MAIPRQIIIVGSGVFGLSTAYYMSRDATFAKSSIILLDAWDFEPDSQSASVHNPGAANADTSRIIRRVYPQGPYAALADEAVQRWHAEWGRDGRYVEQKLLFAAEGSSIRSPRKRGETVNYIKDSYDTSCEMTPGGAESLELWDSLDRIRSELRSSAKPSGNVDNTEEKQQERSLRGFISNDCGWANSGAAMEWLRQEVVRMGRVERRVGEVQRLICSNDGTRVNGVRLQDGVELRADLTIVAAGCHSARILGVPEMCSVESAVVAYIQLSEAESKELKKRNWPLMINTHRGVFCVGPDHDHCLKLGQCSAMSKREILKSASLATEPQTRFSEAIHQPDWENPKVGWGCDVMLSGQGDVVDPEGASINKTLAAFRLFLLELLGPVDLGGLDILESDDALLNKIAVRPFSRVHKCWYNDTPTYDFIVDYHPSYGRSLFVASGGCDHAFKFLPVLGEKVVSILLHQMDMSSSSAPIDSSIEELCKLWKFPAHLVR
ncbi:hypothetical protein ABOM_000277 [Aspergillus bombycis]|uniref:FAD dependent oxidoreductase domain-containing protein n=1 Tax=Aspergillus bombycis TaxID=109264 RepID=A0A1F8AI48_9EURO|nr:hypothetical protein ABOM_000277 [Aspergillus bombycis]OGM51005.1 hypothetical protein ABOM_000277 [Aspergillus bombycis]